MTKAGETTALRLCMERILPPRKGRPVRVDLPKVCGATNIVEAHAAILTAASCGNITLEEASILSGLIDSHPFSAINCTGEILKRHRTVWFPSIALALYACISADSENLQKPLAVKF